MKKICLSVVTLLLLLVLGSCNKDEKPITPPLSEAGDEELFNNLDFTTKSSLDIMVWSGDGQYYEDLGHKDWKPEEIKGQNVAAIYAVAKEYNKIFPNIKINLFSKADDPNGGGVSWEQELENFKTEHGKYPDVWASNSVTRDIAKGLVLNLDIFKDNPYYKNMNPSLMAMTNYYGFQAAIPQYVLPWGVYVNRELAEENNISAPGVDWTFQQYTNFVSKAKPDKGFYGSWDASMRMVRWATVERQLQNSSVENGFIDITTADFKEAVKLLPKQATTAVQSLFGLGQITADEMVGIGNYWGYKAFADSKLLTYDGDPWMLGLSNIADGFNTVLSNDWDIYPCPSLTGGENYVSAVLDPVVVYNYFTNSAAPTENEMNKAKIAYSFASFWNIDTRSWTARANQKYLTDVDKNVLAPSLNDSFPVVTGSDFDKQMEIWYSTDGHKPYKDAAKFPGFAKCVSLWTEGNIYSVSDKAYALGYTDSDGTAVDCLAYLTQFGNPDYVGNVTIDDSTWANTYIAGIPEWNTTMNGHFTKAFEQLKDSLKKYYGFKDTDFK